MPEGREERADNSDKREERTELENTEKRAENTAKRAENIAETRRGGRRKGLGALHYTVIPLCLCSTAYVTVHVLLGTGSRNREQIREHVNNFRDEQRGGKHRELYILLVYLLLRCYCTAVHVLLVTCGRDRKQRREKREQCQETMREERGGKRREINIFIHLFYTFVLLCACHRRQHQG